MEKGVYVYDDTQVDYAKLWQESVSEMQQAKVEVGAPEMAMAAMAGELQIELVKIYQEQAYNFAKNPMGNGVEAPLARQIPKRMGSSWLGVQIAFSIYDEGPDSRCSWRTCAVNRLPVHL